VKVTQRLGQRLGGLGEVARTASEQARERVRERRGHSEHDQPARQDDPGNRPRVAFAGVLDGLHLWLAIDATPGSLALREHGGSRVWPLTSDLTEDDPRYRSVRADLADPAGAAGAAGSGDPGDTGERRYDVVVTAPGGKVHRVWTPPLPAPGPMRTPTTGTGQHPVRWDLARTPDGTLQVTRTPAPPGVILRAIGTDPDGTVTLDLDDAPAGADLRLTDEESGEVLVTLPIPPASPDGRSRVAVAPDDIPGTVGLSATISVGDLPVRRRANDLSQPDAAVLLPQHQSDDDSAGSAERVAERRHAAGTTVVFRWRADGVLRVRRRKAGA